MFFSFARQPNEDQHISTCWNQLQMGFKMLLISALTCYFIRFISLEFFAMLPNILILTIDKFQIWRLFTSFLWPGMSQIAFLSVLFDFYILYTFLPDMQKRLSTVYILLEVIIQTFLCNVVLIVAGLLFTWLQLVSFVDIVGCRMLPTIFVLIWPKIAENPDEPTRFAFCPCLLPMKYVPICFLILYASNGPQMFSMIVYCLLGFYQYMIRKKAILRLPLTVYKAIDSLMPSCIKQQIGYVKVAAVEQELAKVCLTQGCCKWRHQEEQANPFSASVENNNIDSENSNVQVIGKGVAIGGSDSCQNDFRSYWVNQNEQERGEEKEKGAQEQNQNLISENNQLLEKPFNPDSQIGKKTKRGQLDAQLI